MSKPKRRCKGPDARVGIKPVALDAYPIIVNALYNAIEYGLNRANKYANGDELSPEQRARVSHHVSLAIENTISELFKWD